MNGWMLGNICKANGHWQSGKRWRKKWAVSWNKPLATQVTVPQNLSGEYADQYYKMPYFTAPLSWYVTKPDGSRAETRPGDIFAMMGAEYTITYTGGVKRKYFNSAESTHLLDKDGKIINIKTEYTDIVNITEGFWASLVGPLYATRRGKGRFHAKYTIGHNLHTASNWEPIQVIGEGDFTVEILERQINMTVKNWTFTDPNIELLYNGRYKATLIHKPVAVAGNIGGSGGTWTSDKNENGYGFLFVN